MPGNKTENAEFDVPDREPSGEADGVQTDDQRSQLARQRESGDEASNSEPAQQSGADFRQRYLSLRNSTGKTIAKLTGELAVKDSTLASMARISEHLNAERERITVAHAREIKALKTDAETAVSKLESTLAERDATLASVKGAIDQLSAERERLSNDFVEQGSALTATTTRLEHLETERARLEVDLGARESALADAMAEVERLTAECADLKNAHAQRENALVEATNRIDELTTEHARLQSELADRSADSAAASEEAEHLAAERSWFEAELGDRSKALAAAMKEIDKVVAERIVLERELTERDQLLSVVASEVEHLASESERLRSESEKKLRKAASASKKTVADHAAAVSELKRQLAQAQGLSASRTKEVEELRHSTSWRATAPLRKAVEFFRRPRESDDGDLTNSQAARTARRTKPTKPTEGKVAPPSAEKSSSPSTKPPTIQEPNLPEWKQPAALENKLWGGFSREALRDLEEVRRTAPAKSKAAASTAWTLAGWYAVEGEFERAKACIADRGSLFGRGASAKKKILLAAYCDVLSNDFPAARELLTQALRDNPDDADFLLAMANATAAAGAGDVPSIQHDEKRLAWINRVYEQSGLQWLAKLDPAKPLTEDNISVLPGLSEVTSGPRVSVIIPAYNAAKTLPLVFRGLLAQTWANLEILVVDDCSSDSTYDVSREYAKQDDRIVPVRQEKNQGSYCARNRALGMASGDFITVHDANDWSHPQKIETQIRHLLDNENLVANFSNWSRVSEEMLFLGKFRRKDKLIDWNPSSFMFRREVLSKLGGWDRVRISADAEFVYRTRRLFPNGVASVDAVAPLSFATAQPASLTAAGPTHGRTIYHGLRREYGETSRYWHAKAQDDALRLDLDIRERRFPVPGAILPDREAEASCDLLIVSDFNAGPETASHIQNLVEVARAAEQRVAGLQWSHYSRDPSLPLELAVRDMALRGQIRILAPGEKVNASRVLVTTPSILQYEIDRPPEITAKQVAVIADRAPAAGPYNVATGSDPFAYDTTRVCTTLEQVFGTTGVWFGASPEINESLRAGAWRYAVADAHWSPLIDERAFVALPVLWRGDEREQPVLGRIAADETSNWPATAETLRSAYCVEKPCLFSALGSTSYAKKMLGAKPLSWISHDPALTNKIDFLADLDFFVYYPHEDFVGTPVSVDVLRAMAAGRVVVLPPSLQSAYGDGATYADAEDVWPTIEALWRDKEAYLERATVGRAFVCAHFAHSLLQSRFDEASPVYTKT